MVTSDILPANFTISAEAKRAIKDVRAQYDKQWPDNPAAVACIAWGIVKPNDGPQSERVIVGFYQRSMLADVAHGIQEVSGVPLIFFTTEDYVGNFAGKVLDYSIERGFFLRAP
ncbi:MAG: hypothetical protein P8Z80_03850 [Pseudolabrys sp.]